MQLVRTSKQCLLSGFAHMDRDYMSILSRQDNLRIVPRFLTLIVSFHPPTHVYPIVALTTVVPYFTIVCTLTRRLCLFEHVFRSSKQQTVEPAEVTPSGDTAVAECANESNPCTPSPLVSTVDEQVLLTRRAEDRILAIMQVLWISKHQKHTQICTYTYTQVYVRSYTDIAVTLPISVKQPVCESV